MDLGFITDVPQVAVYALTDKPYSEDDPLPTLTVTLYGAYSESGLADTEASVSVELTYDNPQAVLNLPWLARFYQVRVLNAAPADNFSPRDFEVSAFT